MDQEIQMPSARMVAEAMATLLAGKLADQAAREIVLSREEAALCLGLAEGIAESLAHEAGETD